VNLALTVRHGARSRKGVIPEYGWVSGSNSDAEFAGGRFAAATEKAAENCNGHGNCYSARRAASATIETDRSDSTSRTQSVELIGRKRLKRPDVIATGTDRATGPFEKGKTASGDQFSASRGRSPSVAARCAADSPGIRCDPPDPMFPAVSVPTLGSGCMAKQCSASSAALLEWRARLYLTRDRLHGPHRRSLAVATRSLGMTALSLGMTARSLGMTPTPRHCLRGCVSHDREGTGIAASPHQ